MERHEVRPPSTFISLIEFIHRVVVFRVCCAKLPGDRTQTSFLSKFPQTVTRSFRQLGPILHTLHSQLCVGYIVATASLKQPHRGIWYIVATLNRVSAEQLRGCDWNYNFALGTFFSRFVPCFFKVFELKHGICDLTNVKGTLWLADDQRRWVMTHTGTKDTCLK